MNSSSIVLLTQPVPAPARTYSYVSGPYLDSEEQTVVTSENNRQDDISALVPKPKRAYATPTLTVYGTLERITEGVSPTGSKDGFPFGGNPLSRPLG